jgi:hypothetical protein
MALSLLLVGIASSSMSVVVNADEVTNRSITLSDSTAGATNVTYNIQFTVSSAGAGAYVLDFCDNSPIAGDSCTAPAGFSGASASTTTSGASVAELNSSVSTLLVTQTVAGSASVNLTLNGITNPNYVTDTGAGDGFYMRVITYASAGDAASYTGPTVLTNSVDTGGFAMSTTSAIGVSGTVNEYMTFCVANQTISQDCGDANDTGHFPNVTLGTDGVIDPSAVATGNIYTQISTNASSGAVIDIKSDSTGCGGLRLGGTGACNITPETTATTAGSLVGHANFGVLLNTPFGTSGDTNDTGTLDPSGSYSTSDYYMHYVSGDATGVTSPYGDPILNTNSLPVNNENEELTFGASANPNTPAGNYSATLDMIATGTF